MAMIRTFRMYLWYYSMSALLLMAKNRFAFNRWLDSLIVMLDCNFRLKSKDRSISSDPALGSGLAYYVEEDSYQAYLKDCPEQVEVKSLSYHSLVLSNAMLQG